MINLNPKKKLNQSIHGNYFLGANIRIFKCTDQDTFTTIQCETFATVYHFEQMKRCLINSVEGRYLDD